MSTKSTFTSLFSVFAASKGLDNNNNDQNNNGSKSNSRSNSRSHSRSNSRSKIQIHSQNSKPENRKSPPKSNSLPRNLSLQKNLEEVAEKLTKNNNELVNITSSREDEISLKTFGKKITR